jgi:hypothetical protein
MNSKIIASFLIFILILVIPSISAQEISIAGKAQQKSVEITISDEGNAHVKHIIKSSNSPKQFELIDGTIKNLIITDEDGNKESATVIGENDSVMILPSNSNSIVEYDLENLLIQKDSLWTLDFLYLESTTFFIPEKINLIYVNERPVNMAGEKGFICHGCQMVLEYSFDEQKDINHVTWEDRGFDVEINTITEIKDFNFNQPLKEINFKINEDNQFVTIVIPLELLWKPYLIFLDDKKILFHEYMNNGTHVWLNMRPETAGEISIIGTTVVPEFPVIAPLAIGFLIIMMVPLMKKFNLR